MSVDPWTPEDEARLRRSFDRFRVGDRVGAVAELRAQYRESGSKCPGYGHVVSIGGQSLVWVRDHLGGEWGLHPDDLEHID